MQKTASSERTTWILILIMVTFILVKGLFVYLVVGDKGQPGWDYRPVPDVPGESPYAIYEPLPHRQHVRGRMGE
jgi:hypothetical protein